MPTFAIAFAPNGRTIAVSMGDGNLRLFDWAVGKKWSFKAANQGPFRLTFSPDGTRLAGAENTTALVWGVADIVSTPLARPERVGSADIDAWSEQLKSDHTKTAYQAVWNLVAMKDAAVPKLKTQVTRAEPAVLQNILRWIVELDSRICGARQGRQKLLRYGDDEYALLEAAAKEPRSLEQGRRLQAIITQLKEGRVPTHKLKELRALMALEQIGTPASRAVLEWLNEGVPNAWITQQARLALNRMDQASRAP